MDRGPHSSGDRLLSEKKKIRLLVSDIDGTLLDGGEPTAGLSTLRTILWAHRGAVRLVYATGRSFASTRSLIDSGALPEADGICAFVGTELWLPPWKNASEEYAAHIGRGWRRDRVSELAAGFPQIEWQPDEFQSPFKASFFLREPTLLPAFELELRRAEAGARAIYSCDEYLDVLPASAGKRNAVDFVRGLFGIDRFHVLTAGDSGNDLDMLLDDRFFGVAVGNAETELSKLAKAGSASLHESDLPFAAGVLDGAEVFDFWPG